MILDQDTEIVTLRDVVEAKLMEQFSGCMYNLDDDGIKNIENNERSPGYLEMAFLISGQNRLSTSTHYPRGLLYRDQNGSFGVGVFFSSEKWEPCIHIIAPQGANWQRAVDHFSYKVWEHLPEAEIFIRYTYLTRCDRFQPLHKWETVDVD